MTKEEILEKSRMENSNKDVFDLEVQKTAATAAYFSSLGLCAFVSILSWIFTKRVGLQCWVIFFGMLSVTFSVKFIKMKKLHELFVALAYLAIFILLTIAYILQLTGRLGTGAAA
jgi:Ca2+-dependent lipid-binding protein